VKGVENLEYNDEIVSGAIRDAKPASHPPPAGLKYVITEMSNPGGILVSKR